MPANSAERPRTARRASPTLMARLNRHGLLVLLVGLTALIAVVAATFLAPRSTPAPAITPAAVVPLVGPGVPDGATTATAAVDGQTLTLISPASPAVGLAIFFHGEGADATAAAQSEWIAPLVAAGWAVAAGDLHGDSWGSPSSSSDLVDLTSWASAQTGLTPQLYVSDGAGALVSLNALTRGVATTACWYGVESVTDLESLSDDPTAEARIAAAYRARPSEADIPVENATALASTGASFRFVGADARAPFTAANSGALAESLAEEGAAVTTAQLGDAASLGADLAAYSVGCAP